MMNFDKMSHSAPEWLNRSQIDSDVIMSSHVRLARNLQSYRFVSTASDNDLKEIVHHVHEAILKIDNLKDARPIDAGQFLKTELSILLERQLITSEFLESNKPRECVFSSDESFSMMVNEIDHLRFQKVQAGFGLHNIWNNINQIDQDLNEYINFSKSDEFGFLTTYPEDVGTGVRFSVFAHLPALKFLNEITDVFETIIPSGVTILNISDKENGIDSNYFRISNKYTLGWSEKDLLNRFTDHIQYIIDKERSARVKIFNNDTIIIEDKIFRALGVLQHAKIISSSELIGLISTIRLGVDLKILNNFTYKQLDELLILCQPAHLQTQYRNKLDKLNRDRIRATYVQNKLNLS